MHSSSRRSTLSKFLTHKLFWVVVFSANPALAETIKFPEKELATESVLPVFEKREAVKDRNVPLTERLEVGLGGGVSLREALYNNKNFNLNVTYHFDEEQGLGLDLVSMADGISDKAEALAEGRGQLLPGQFFNADLAPRPELFAILNYKFNGYYGKISLTKQSVMNLSLYGAAGVHMVKFTDSTSFGVNAGIGQKLYFNRNWGLKLDLSLLIYQGPDPTSMPQNQSVAVTTDDLEKTTFFKTLFNFGAVYLF